MIDFEDHGYRITPTEKGLLIEVLDYHVSQLLLDNDTLKELINQITRKQQNTMHNKLKDMVHEANNRQK